MIVRYLPYTLSLRAPAVLTSLGGDPNSSRTLPFIPGSAVRGAVARALGDPGSDAERLHCFRALILDGTVRFFNAYPRVAGRRAVPTPISFRVDKSGVTGRAGDVTVWDLAAFDANADADDASWPDASLSALPEPFVSIGAAQPIRFAPRINSRLHQQRDRARGRAWKETSNGREVAHGAIFAFEFLEADQEFDGLVQVHAQNSAACDNFAEAIRSALQGPILLGRSRRGGYGGDATISWGTACDRELTGQGVVNADLLAGTRFRALLTAPYVGRDPDTGQIDPCRLAIELEEAFAKRVKVLHRRWSFERVGGFNRKWRLELPQALACAAGSVLVLEATAAIPLGDLLAVEHRGLGERRVEGFGRLVFLQAPSRQVVLRAPHASARTAPSGQPPELVRFVEARILDAAIERTIEEEAARIARGAKAPPSPSLLGRLRTAMRGEPESALRTLQTWLAQEGEHRLKRPAMDQLERCRIANGQCLAAWLCQMVDEQNDEPLTTLLRSDALEQRHHVVSKETARKHWMRRTSWIRARLIDSTLAALARTQRERRSS